MPRVPLQLREHVLAFWRGHSEAWKLSGLTQREYCEQHQISLKSLGNWRAQLKRIGLAGPKARWGRYPRLRKPGDLSHMVNHMAKPGRSHMAKRPASSPPRSAPSVPQATAGGRRQFSEAVKQCIVAETCKPGASISAVARRYGIDLRMLFRWRRALGIETLPDPLGVVSADARSAVASSTPVSTGDQP